MVRRLNHLLMHSPASLSGRWLAVVAVLIGACVPTIATPTPEGPAPLASSPTILPFLPTDDVASSIGRSNPTEAALIAEGELADTGLYTPTLIEPTAQHIPLQFLATDGTLLTVSFYGAAVRPAPLMLLLHDSGQDSDAWGLYAPQLQAAGYNVYLTDLRGRRDDPDEVDWAVVVSDMLTILQNVTSSTNINTGQVSIVGIGTGGNVAMFACAQIVSCTQAVAISPRPHLSDFNFSVLESSYGQGRRITVFSADDDEAATLATSELSNVLGSVMVWQRFSTGGRGSELLRNQPDALAQLLALFGA